MVEQGTHNPLVLSSNLGGPTIKLAGHRGIRLGDFFIFKVQFLAIVTIASPWLKIKRFSRLLLVFQLVLYCKFLYKNNETDGFARYAAGLASYRNYS